MSGNPEGARPPSPASNPAPAPDSASPEAVSGTHASGSDSFPIVGVGASAGGLEAFARLLEHTPAGTPAGFVLIQHLAPSHESQLAALLAKRTELEVVTAAEDMPVLSGRVHVLPADRVIWIAKGVLHLAPRGEQPVATPTIDRFLESLALDQGAAAIGVVLSGTGTDGMKGLTAIKEHGGVTFAQDEASAQFPTMPHNAWSTGYVDHVLAPEAIATEIARLASGHRTDVPAESAALLPADEKALRDIFTLLHRTVGVDFSTYRQSTVRRRILRRMEMLAIPSLTEFVTRLGSNREDVEGLCRDLFIQVTRFFRDPDAFEALRTRVLPAIFAAHAARKTIRVWVPGCATGEEAYSIAIELAEYRARTGSPNPYQILASDITPSAIATARAGIYPASISDSVSAERLERHFVKTGDSYRIAKELRDACVFAEHDVINDPPFSRLDLISCRNLLIYFPALQPRVLGIFHYALLPSGYLLLGNAESAMFSSDLFIQVDAKTRLFTRRDVAHSPPRPRTGRTAAEGTGAAGSESARGIGRGSNRLTLRAQADRMLLARYVPAAVLVDAQLEVVDVRGEISPYLQFRPGKMGSGLLRMAHRSGLSARLANAVRDSRATDSVVRMEHVPFSHGGDSNSVSIEVIPLGEGETGLSMILFELDDPVAPPRVAPGLEPGAAGIIAAKDRQIAELRRELSDTREQVSALMEEHEDRLEESHSATEEAMSNSEELQSINEELETTKEELQATNEELVTVNSELESRNSQLQSAQDFTDSIIATIPEPLVVLADELYVRSANRAYYDFTRSTEADTLGRPLFQVHSGLWDSPLLRSGLAAAKGSDELFNDLELVIDSHTPEPRTVLLTARRFRGLSLILIAVQDVTRRRASERALRLTAQRLGEVHKMEAIGRLAGGVAHDFNNLLTVITGYVELMLHQMSDSDPMHAQVVQIQLAAERAVGVTRQLLAVSHRQVMQPRHLDLNLVVREMEPMLRRLLGEDITLALDLHREPQWVRADPGLMGQVILNLALNSRDAVKHRGRVTLATAPFRSPAPGDTHGDLPAGRFVLLRVEDDGVGMSPETLAQCFEPFFTTKPTGEGTGLGLATVYGIIEQSGGHILVRSEPGKGTAFSIYLPGGEAAAQPAPALIAPAARAAHGTETILFVEDEPAIRTLGRAILEQRGYTVLLAANGREALELADQHPEPIGLMISDVRMPIMGGRELAEFMKIRRPGIRTMFISGYTEDEVLKEDIHSSQVAFLHKPFTPAALTHLVRAILDAS